MQRKSFIIVIQDGWSRKRRYLLSCDLLRLLAHTNFIVIAGGKAKPLKAAKKEKKELDEDDLAFKERQRAGGSKIREFIVRQILMNVDSNRGQGQEGTHGQGQRQRSSEYRRSRHQEIRKEVNNCVAAFSLPLFLQPRFSLLYSVTYSSNTRPKSIPGIRPIGVQHVPRYKIQS